MRFNIRLKLGDITLFGMISHTQRLKGITSKLSNNKHIILLDIDVLDNKHSLNDILDYLKKIQYKYKLPTMFITSDNEKYEKSFHVYCFKQVTFRKYIHILTDIPFVDWNFIYWTMVRGEATLRINRKKGRPRQKIITVLKSDIPFVVPDDFGKKIIKYDTGIDKKGIIITNRGIF